MPDYIAQSAYFGAALTLAVYLFSHWLSARLRTPLANPMLICLALVILLLLVLDIDYAAHHRTSHHHAVVPLLRVPGR